MKLYGFQKDRLCVLRFTCLSPVGEGEGGSRLPTICKFVKYLARPLLHTFLFVTSMYGLADKLNHIAEGLVTSPRSGYLAQVSQINKVPYFMDIYLRTDYKKNNAIPRPDCLVRGTKRDG